MYQICQEESKMIENVLYGRIVWIDFLRRIDGTILYPLNFSLNKLEVLMCISNSKHINLKLKNSYSVWIKYSNKYVEWWKVLHLLSSIFISLSWENLMVMEDIHTYKNICWCSWKGVLILEEYTIIIIKCH